MIEILLVVGALTLSSLWLVKGVLRQCKIIRDITICRRFDIIGDVFECKTVKYWHIIKQIIPILSIILKNDKQLDLPRQAQWLLWQLQLFFALGIIVLFLKVDIDNLYEYAALLSLIVSLIMSFITLKILSLYLKSVSTNYKALQKVDHEKSMTAISQNRQAWDQNTSTDIKGSQQSISTKYKLFQLTIVCMSITGPTIGLICSSFIQYEQLIILLIAISCDIPIKFVIAFFLWLAKIHPQCGISTILYRIESLAEFYKTPYIDDTPDYDKNDESMQYMNTPLNVTPKSQSPSKLIASDKKYQMDYPSIYGLACDESNQISNETISEDHNILSAEDQFLSPNKKFNKLPIQQAEIYFSQEDIFQVDSDDSGYQSPKNLEGIIQSQPFKDYTNLQNDLSSIKEENTQNTSVSWIVKKKKQQRSQSQKNISKKRFIKIRTESNSPRYKKMNELFSQLKICSKPNPKKNNAEPVKLIYKQVINQETRPATIQYKLIKSSSTKNEINSLLKENKKSSLLQNASNQYLAKQQKVQKLVLSNSGSASRLGYSESVYSDRKQLKTQRGRIVLGL